MHTVRFILIASKSFFLQSRQMLIEMAGATIRAEMGAEHIDAVARGETTGIPFTAWLADSLNLPMRYVYKKTKGFGRNAQIEGALEEGMQVLLVENLTPNDLSKINFCEACAAQLRCRIFSFA